MAKNTAATKSSSTRVTNDPKTAQRGEQLTKDGKTKKLTPKDVEDVAEHVQRQVHHFVEHLQQWIEKNSQPKRYDLSKRIVRREPTRWSKRGPMARKDWVRFYNWAAKNAAPKPPYQPKVRPGKKNEPTDPVPLEDLMEHAAKMAIPRIKRKKYEHPAAPEYAYTPQIDPKKAPKKDRGRPFPPPEVPTDFQHIEVEADFWSQLRFPLRTSTASYNPTENILLLAQPKVVPPLRQHCPIPERPVEYVAPRRRMTHRQWREHKRRLEYLAKPIYRPIIDYYYC